MSEFVGRTGSRRVYSYPESRRNTTLPFARNFAAGPGETTDVASGAGVIDGTQIPWGVVESFSTWSAAITYATGDRVNFSGNGSTYISLANGNLNNPPDISPAFWALNVDVTITPRVTGIIQIAGVVFVKNAAQTPVAVLVQVQLGVDGGALPAGGRSPIPLLEDVLVDVASVGGMAIPILVDLPSILAIGVTRTIQIVVSEFISATGGITLITATSTLSVQEVPAATG